MSALVQDFRYAFWLLRKSPVFTSVAVATLALGIGANTAIFTLIDRVLLGRLPVSRPGELVLFRSPGPNPGHTWSDTDLGTSFSYPMYRALRERSGEFSGLAGEFPFSADVAVRGRTEEAAGELVSGNYFELLGVTPFLGRTLTPADDRVPGGHPLAVLSFAYYGRRFGANPAVLNKTISVNGSALTVVGIARPDFDGIQRGRPADIFVPLMMKAAMTPSWDGLDDPKDHWVQIIGRLKPGETISRAQARLAVTYHALLVDSLPLVRRWNENERRQYLDRRLLLNPGGRGRPVLENDVRTPLLALMGMVGAVLLIACANLAGLLLARGAARRREHGIRLAVGADRAAIFRQTLVESLLLALAGGAMSVLVATGSIRALLAALPADADLRRVAVSIDLPVLLFTLAATLAAGLFFGMAPAWKASRLDPNRVLHGGGGAGGEGLRFRKWLVTGQIALSAALLVGAGLFARSLHNLMTVDLGLRPDRVLQFSVNPRLIGYDRERTERLAQSITDSLASLPGVHSVSAAEIGPFQGDDSSGDLSIEGITLPPEAKNHVRRNEVGPDYFATLGVPLLAGREFRWNDSAGTPKVAVVNEALVRALLGGRDPIGRRIGFGAADVEIVGVVRDSRAEVDEDVTPFAYFPYRQDPRLRRLTFYVQTVRSPAAAAGEVRSVVTRLEPNLPAPEVSTLRSQIDDSIARLRLVGTLSMAFAGLAVLLAGIGVYGVLAYSVVRRTKEIGIRMAIGASRGGIQRLVLGEVARFLVAGAIAGLAFAFVAGRVVASLLFGVRATDPAAYAGATLAILVASLAAGYLPARRAATIDPMRALREE